MTAPGTSEALRGSENRARPSCPVLIGTQGRYAACGEPIFNLRDSRLVCFFHAGYKGRLPYLRADLLTGDRMREARVAVPA